MARDRCTVGALGAFTLLAALVAILADCGGSDMSPGPAFSSSSPSTATAAKQVLADEQAGTAVDPRIVAADNGLGLSLLDQLDQNTTGNIALSPTSIALAFEMLYNGAAGSTQQGMSQALELGSFTSAQDVDTANASLQAALMDADPSVTIAIANSLWVHLADDPVLPSFTEVNQDYYAAEIGDLAGAPANVNAWVSQATQGLITQLLSQADYSRATLVLADALYFKGSWTTPFNPASTSSAPFTLVDGTQVTCQMMQQTGGDVDYYQGANFQMVRLPYGKGHFSMVIILPAVGVGLEPFVASMTVSALDGWISQLSSNNTVLLGLPKFKTTYVTEATTGPSLLPQALTALGMGVAFTPQADFSGIAPGLYVNDAVHQTVIDVDEAGTVAAAVTAISVSSLVQTPTVAITLDRPFFYAIRNDDNGALLFVGLLMNPTAS